VITEIQSGAQEVVTAVGQFSSKLVAEAGR